MAGISSKHANNMEVNQKFQGQEMDEEFDLNWYAFKWRSHDLQIGRFIQIDPLADTYAYNSTYAFSENKVTGHRELEGLEAVVATHFIVQEADDYPTGYLQLRYLHPDDADSKYGHNGKLTNFVYMDLDGCLTEFSIYEPDLLKKGKNLFPQLILYGSGKNYGFEMGSEWDPNGGEAISMNFGGIGGDNEFGLLELISVLGKIPTSTGKADDLRKYLIDNVPKVAEKAGHLNNRRSPNARICLQCNNEAHEGPPFVITNKLGEVTDTVYPPWQYQNENIDTLIIPNKERMSKFDSPHLDQQGRPKQLPQKDK